MKDFKFFTKKPQNIELRNYWIENFVAQHAAILATAIIKESVLGNTFQLGKGISITLNFEVEGAEEVLKALNILIQQLDPNVLTSLGRKSATVFDLDTLDKSHTDIGTLEIFTNRLFYSRSSTAHLERELIKNIQEIDSILQALQLPSPVGTIVKGYI